jgi:hypothetical protein
MNWPWDKKKNGIGQQRSIPPGKPVYAEDVGMVRNLHEKLAAIPVGYGFLLPTREGMKEFKCISIRPYPEKAK